MVNAATLGTLEALHKHACAGATAGASNAECRSRDLRDAAEEAVWAVRLSLALGLGASASRQHAQVRCLLGVVAPLSTYAAPGMLSWPDVARGLLAACESSGNVSLTDDAKAAARKHAKSSAVDTLSAALGKKREAEQQKHRNTWFGRMGSSFKSGRSGRKGGWGRKGGPFAGYSGLEKFRLLLKSAPTHEPSPTKRSLAMVASPPAKPAAASPSFALPYVAAASPVMHVPTSPPLAWSTSDHLVALAGHIRRSAQSQDEHELREKAVAAAAAAAAEAAAEAAATAAAAAARAEAKVAEVKSRLAETGLALGALEALEAAEDNGAQRLNEMLEGAKEAIGDLLAAAPATTAAGGGNEKLEEEWGCPEAVSVLCDELDDLRCRADALLGAWDDAAEHGAALAAEAAAETGGVRRAGGGGDGSPGMLRRALSTDEQDLVESAWGGHDDSSDITVCSLPSGAGGSTVDILGKHFGR